MAVKQWDIQKIIAAAYCYKSVGDVQAIDVKGNQRYTWYLDDANKFMKVYGWYFRDRMMEDGFWRYPVPKIDVLATAKVFLDKISLYPNRENSSAINASKNLLKDIILADFAPNDITITFNLCKDIMKSYGMHDNPEELVVHLAKGAE